MTKSWVSGDKSSEVIEKLRSQISQLERRREELIEKNKRKIYDWTWYILNSPRAPRDIDEIRSEPGTQEVKEIIALYELLNQEIMDKEASLGEKLDEQTRFDSLG